MYTRAEIRALLQHDETADLLWRLGAASSPSPGGAHNAGCRRSMKSEGLVSRGQKAKLIVAHHDIVLGKALIFRMIRLQQKRGGCLFGHCMLHAWSVVVV